MEGDAGEGLSGRLGSLRAHRAVFGRSGSSERAVLQVSASGSRVRAGPYVRLLELASSLRASAVLVQARGQQGGDTARLGAGLSVD